MTDLVARVLLKADASGLVGQVRPATAAVQELGTAVGAAGGRAKTLAADTAGAAEAMRGAGSEAQKLAADNRQVAAALDLVETRTQTSNRTHRDGADALNRHAFGARNLGQQFGDLGTSIAGGIDPARAFGQQAGQIGYALSEMGGKAGAVGAFLTGGWGVALTIAASFVAPYVAKLIEGGDAADELEDKLGKAATSADSFGSAQSQLSKVVDLTTGKLKTQNAVLIQTIKLQAQSNLQAAQKKLDDLRPDPGLQIKAPNTFGGIGASGAMGVGGGNLDAGVSASIRVAAQQARLNKIIGSLTTLVNLPEAKDNPGAYSKAVGKGIDAAIAGIDRLAVGGKVAGRSLEEVKLQILGIGTAANDKAAALQSLSALAGGPVPDDLKPYAKPTSTKAPRQAASRTGDSAARQIAAEARELDTLTRQLTAAFNPAKAAADAYLETLEEIARVVKDGRLAPGEGANAEARALDKYRESDAKAQRDSFDRVFGDVLVQAGAELDAIVQQTSDGFRAELKDGAVEAGDELTRGVANAGAALRGLVQDIGDLFGGQIGASLNQLIGTKDRAKQYGDTIAPQITDALKGLKLGLSDEQAGTLGASIGTKAGKVLAGAQTGQAVAGIGNALGIKMSSTGAQIGGAIGSFIPIPGGEIIGSIAGGLIGNLFKKTTKGAVSITGADTSSYTGSGKYADALTGNASSVQAGLKQVADTLGARLGAFSVAIGKNGDYYHVADNAGADVAAKHPKSPLLYEGKDEAAAVAAALANAIADGAIVGLSAAVAKALRSSTDIDKAVQEAVKVRDLERSLGGLDGQIKQLFSDFDTNAAERVRLAKAYGLDLLAVEKLNAEQRANVLDETLNGRVGQLKGLLSNLQYGDLFEGSATDRRNAILTEIGDTKADAEAGKDGAADKLADLYRTLVATSKEAFGTAGSEYTLDRSSATEGIERVLKTENDRIAAAASQQAATTNAVTAGNALANEGNDLAVRTNELLTELRDLMTRQGTAAPSLDLAALARSYS